ncbi:hypothetical protein K505DRAFT_360507 [Melanomma pulvis-pyrius CBS 109.77]|uniref:Uncharacterized protein n=1 Tax=Melanomma pulvis-pyrius CBS 109.77 TaxID=1314802 RepID=A0A6A6XHF5_9PLEO|nr:hypothetical protein K505DRAFT_360507 [Melanomma pulvis-pyrius CBS 109.77]
MDDFDHRSAIGNTPVVSSMPNIQLREAYDCLTDEELNQMHFSTTLPSQKKRHPNEYRLFGPVSWTGQPQEQNSPPTFLESSKWMKGDNSTSSFQRLKEQERKDMYFHTPTYFSHAERLAHVCAHMLSGLGLEVPNSISRIHIFAAGSPAYNEACRQLCWILRNVLKELAAFSRISNRTESSWALLTRLHWPMADLAQMYQEFGATQDLRELIYEINLLLQNDKVRPPCPANALPSYRPQFGSVTNWATVGRGNFYNSQGAKFGSHGDSFGVSTARFLPSTVTTEVCDLKICTTSPPILAETPKISMPGSFPDIKAEVSSSEKKPTMLGRYEIVKDEGDEEQCSKKVKSAPASNVFSNNDETLKGNDKTKPFTKHMNAAYHKQQQATPFSNDFFKNTTSTPATTDNNPFFKWQKKHS